MKPAKKGESWDVFSTNSADGDLQIQRVDCVDVPGACQFRGDAEAILHVIACAKRGDEYALAALWEVLDEDSLVNRILWCQAMDWTLKPISYSN